MSYRTSVATVTALGAYAGHEGGDFPVQSDRCARLKQARTTEGRRALLTHGATYGATQLATKAAFYRIAGVRVPFAAQVAGTVTEAAVHVLIDDGRLLAKFAESTGKWNFHELGAPRRVTGVVDVSDGETERVRQVTVIPLDTEGNPAPEWDEYGRLQHIQSHDNPSPSTGRALLDQALHKWLQVPIGVAVTTGVAMWLRRTR